MAKLGTYSYPDIRFGDAVEISGRILSKFKGAVTVKGLAWELGMAENSGTLFAKIAALRDFGLVEGRGELRVSDLARKIIHPTSSEEHRESSIAAFQRVELLRALYERFEGEVPDDTGLLVGLEETTKAPRNEIVRRFTLIQKHLADATRVMKRTTSSVINGNPKSLSQGSTPSHNVTDDLMGQSPGDDRGLRLVAGGTRLFVPLTVEYLDVAINLLKALRTSMATSDDTSQEESNIS